MSKPGHNSKVQAGPISADRLKSFIERIEKLEEERKAIGGDIKDVYSEAKGVGYDVATMRKIVALRAKDPADRAEAETLLDVYRHALGMDTIGYGGAPREPSEEELVEIAGRIAGEVDRCMSLAATGKPPKIEEIKRLIGCSNGKAQKLRGMIATRLEQFSRLSAETRENPKPEDGDDGITGGEDGKAEVDHGAGEEGSVRRQSDAKDAVGHERGDGAPGAGRDDHREDGGGLRGIGAAQAQLTEAPTPPSVGAVGEDASIAAMEEAGARLRASLAARAAGNR